MLRVRSARGRHDVVVAAEPSHRVGELADALGLHVGLNRGSTLASDRLGVVLDPDLPIDRVDLAAGDVVALDLPPDTRLPDRSGAPLVVDVVAGPDSGWSQVIRGPGRLWKECVMDLPSWADFELSAEDKINLTHSGERIFIRIPPGPPTWQLKLCGSDRLEALETLIGDCVTIADQPPGGEKKLKIKGENND